MSRSQWFDEFNHDLLRFPPLVWVRTCINPFQSIFLGVYNQVLQIMLYLQKHGKVSLATLVLSHIYRTIENLVA